MDILRDVGMSKIRGENGNIEEYIETETVRALKRKSKWRKDRNRSSKEKKRSWR